MKYLFCFRPNKELSDLIHNQEFSKKSNIDPYSTLYRIDSLFDKNQIIEPIKNLQLPAFYTKTIQYDNFENNCLVLRLEKTKELMNLHYEIVNKQKLHNENSLHILNNYNPHITVSKDKKFKQTDDLINIPFYIDHFVLYQKQNKEDLWELIEEFNLF